MGLKKGEKIKFKSESYEGAESYLKTWGGRLVSRWNPKKNIPVWYVV